MASSSYSSSPSHRFVFGYLILSTLWSLGTILGSLLSGLVLSEAASILISFPYLISAFIYESLVKVYLNQKLSGFTPSGQHLPTIYKNVSGKHLNNKNNSTLLKRSVLRIKRFIHSLSPIVSLIRIFWIGGLIWSFCVLIAFFFGARPYNDEFKTGLLGLFVVIKVGLPVILLIGPSVDSFYKIHGISNYLIREEDEEEETLNRVLRTNLAGLVVGLWFGAFPIPLDWDRDWQKWPLTCLIGGSIGYFSANLYSLIVVYRNNKLKRKIN